MAWTEEMVDDLRRMWTEGKTANEIAKILNVSKNSIVGKVHRLCLTARPSPIKKKSDKPENPAPEKNQQTMAQESVKQPKKDVVKPVQTETKPEAPEIKETVKEKNKNGNVKLVDLDSHTCRWPIGDPRDDDFCFCGKKVRAGQTYCDEHSQVAYVKANVKK